MIPLLLACALAGQFDAFEVATIKPTPWDWNGGRFIRMQTAHQMIARNHALRTLIAAAYNISPKAVIGTESWIETEKFDIVAEAPGETRPTLDQQMVMLRALIDERFKLKFHRERREMPIYTLSIAKTGIKFKESPDVEPPPEGFPALAFVIAPPVVRLPAHHTTMDEIVSVMQRAALDRPLVDKTGLTGHYDFELVFSPDDSLFGGMLKFEPGEDAPPGFLAALQLQLGLKLEATRGAVDVFVIDRASPPTGN